MSPAASAAILTSGFRWELPSTVLATTFRQADGKLCVIGNSQAGWAVMMLAVVRPELSGPIHVGGITGNELFLINQTAGECHGIGAQLSF